jgi:hypothetical protein
MEAFKNDKNKVSSETLKYWAECSEKILKAKELELLDFNSPFTEAQIKWAEMSEEEKTHRYLEENPIIDRWQSEAEAMEE